jgi:hypothetical protein
MRLDMTEKLFDSTAAFERLIGDYVKAVNKVAMKDNFEVQKRLYQMMLEASSTQNYRSNIDHIDSERDFDYDAEEAFLSCWKLDDNFIEVVSAKKCHIDGDDCWLVVYTTFISNAVSIFTVRYSEGKVPEMDLTIYNR